MRTIPGAGCIFAKGRREQYRIHTRRQIVGFREPDGKVIVSTAAQYEFDLILRRKRLKIIQSKSIGFPRLRALHVDYLDDPRRYLLQWALSACLEQNLIMAVKELLHERNKFAFLQHGLTACDLHQPAPRAQTAHLTQDFIR